MNASTVSCAPPSHSVLSSIRRLVEPYTPGFDVWSLVQLLEDMRRAAEAFGRSEIEGLFDASDAPAYEPVDQFNGYDVFQFAWIAPDEALAVAA